MCECHDVSPYPYRFYHNTLGLDFNDWQGCAQSLSKTARVALLIDSGFSPPPLSKGNIHIGHNIFNSFASRQYTSYNQPTHVFDHRHPFYKVNPCVINNNSLHRDGPRGFPKQTLVMPTSFASVSTVAIVSVSTSFAFDVFTFDVCFYQFHVCLCQFHVFFCEILSDTSKYDKFCLIPPNMTNSVKFCLTSKSVKFCLTPPNMTNSVKFCLTSNSDICETLSETSVKFCLTSNSDKFCEILSNTSKYDRFCEIL